MDRTDPFYRQAELVVRILPLVAKHEEFALKGGTAINFFLRDMPRLSVDIDLTYLPRYPYDVALPAIRRGLDEIVRDIHSAIPRVRFLPKTDKFRIAADLNGCMVKIEVSPVMRGAVWPVERLEVARSVEKNFGYSENPILSFYDLYAGKICAALDRQHPRDLFDIKFLFDHEGLDRKLLSTFLLYLSCHKRPIAELLDPTAKDITKEYKGEFKKMTRSEVSLDTLIGVRDKLVNGLHCSLTDNDKKFLLSVKAKHPDWGLIDAPDCSDLPALKWKIKNLRQMSEDKHKRAFDKLQKILDRI